MAITVIHTKMPNTISIDVEEYFHAENLQGVTPRRRWNYLPSRVEAATIKTLALLEGAKTKATFFILGTVARRHPSLVRAISDAGHEIASHGFRHHLVYNQTKQQFYRDIYTTKMLLENLSGREVIGYRAPSFSITEKTPWAHEMLVQAGYRYDSSCYPTWHPRYANQGASRKVFSVTVAKKQLIVFPLAVATVRLAGKTICCPVAGGAYWRLLPGSYIRWGLHQLEKNEISLNCYAHPWEFDPDQPLFLELPFLKRLRHYGRTESFSKRFTSFVRDFKFSPICEALQCIDAPSATSTETTP